MVKNALWFAVGGLAVALVAGCSSPAGCRTCPKDAAVPPAAVPATLPSAPGAAALPFGGQKKCPVTGEDLGSMGKPVAVTLKGETVYVCCRGCAAKAQADPDKTLAAVQADRAGR